MPVDTKHKDYDANIQRWQRARACAEGSDAVKALRGAVLPMLDSHKSEAGGIAGIKSGVGGASFNYNVNAGGPSTKYDEYLLRALFYNATGRTAAGLAGAIFQKEPKVEKTPKDIVKHLEDVTLNGVSLELFGLEITYDVLVVGRAGILVDMPKEVKGEDVRPYWVSFAAEDIFSWVTERIDGKMMLTRVVLRESVDTPNVKDPFMLDNKVTYRVLALEDDKYTVTIWSPSSEQGSTLVAGETITPKRRGKPLSEIPFVFVGPCTTSPDVQKAPLLDLADVNLSHFRTMADLEHGLHFTALPTPWVSGAAAANEDGPKSIGSGVLWILGEGGSAGMLEFSGAGLRSLREAEQEKRKMMATLGARLLEDQATVGETATAFIGRHSGEQASLHTVTNSVEKALTSALRWHVWWAGTAGETPREVDSLIQVNKDFYNIKMSSQELMSWVQALQAGAISYETFYMQLEQGEMTRPGVDSDQELKDIEAFGAGAASGVMGGADQLGADQLGGDQNLPPTGPGIEEGDQVFQDTGPYKLVKRKGKFLIITADSGEVHGTFPTPELARKQLAVLEIALKKEKK